MAPPAERYDFASDNTAAICPPAWAALEEANADAAISYGEDKWTRRVIERVREIFETDCEVFLIFNGTAANALALAHLCRSYHGVICHERAHSHTDGRGAVCQRHRSPRLLPEIDHLAGWRGRSLFRRDEEWHGRGRTGDLFPQGTGARVRLSGEARRAARFEDAISRRTLGRIAANRRMD